jgi:hypothetical protein
MTTFFKAAAQSERPDDLLQAAVRKASSEGADDGIRTHTSLFARTDFKSVASAISPHRPCLAKNTQERPLRPKNFFALAEILEASVRPQPPSRERRLCLSRRRQVLKNFASSVADPLGEKRYAKLRPHRHKAQRQERPASRRDV